MAHSSLTKAEAERLEVLVEEAAEVIKCATKILRNGSDNYHPDEPHVRNSVRLSQELLDLFTVVERMIYHDDIPSVDFSSSWKVWARKMRWMHHQPPFHHPYMGPGQLAVASGDDWDG